MPDTCHLVNIWAGSFGEHLPRSPNPLAFYIPRFQIPKSSDQEAGGFFPPSHTRGKLFLHLHGPVISQRLLPLRTPQFDHDDDMVFCGLVDHEAFHVQRGICRSCTWEKLLFIVHEFDDDDVSST